MADTVEAITIIPAARFWADLTAERDAWRKGQGYKGAFKPVKLRCKVCYDPVAPAHATDANAYAHLALCRRCLRHVRRA